VRKIYVSEEFKLAVFFNLAVGIIN